MKLKCLPTDFQVTEQISLTPGKGPFALYRLTKESIGTLEAIAALARHWKLPRHAIHFAGLKDKHAQTTQFITIHHGPRRGLKQTKISLEYIDQTERPIHASDILANAFTIVLRDLEAAETEQIAQAISHIQTDGIPNYFDDQRFGSLGQSGEFIARAWCQGNDERALWLAMAEPNARDRSQHRDEKQFLRDHWNDWEACRQSLPHSTWQNVFAFLQEHPSDFRRAMAQTPHDLRSLWLAAYQSHLWNLLLSEQLTEVCGTDRLLRQSIARQNLAFFTHLEPHDFTRLSQLALPLPSARLHLDDSPLKRLYDRVLGATGITLRELRVKYPRDTFFSKGDRAAIVIPGHLQAQTDNDQQYQGQKQITLRFSLPRGAYATILLKRLGATLASQPSIA